MSLPVLLQDGLESNASLFAGKTALICRDGRLSYAEIDALADRVANGLIAAGVRRGDRVAIWLNNSLETVAAIFGALKASAVFVVVNHGTKPGKLAYIVNNCRAAVLVTDAQLLTAEVAGGLASGAPSLRMAIVRNLRAETSSSGLRQVSFESVLREFPASRPRRQSIDLDLASIIYTSGSTGEPKGVMCDHGNMVFAAASIVQYLQNRQEDIVIALLPFSFDYGLYQLLMTFTFGGTLVLEESFNYPATILQRIQQERVTGFPGVPTIYTMLLGMDLSGFDLSSLRYMTNTAAALPVSHIQALRAKFPSVTLFSMYGLTETKRTLYLPPGELDRRPGSVGIAIPGTEVWLEDEEGNRLGPNQTGELVIRGRHVMRGYWEDPVMTASRYRPGPLPGERLCYSGDLFRMDEDGFMYFVARKDDIIKSRGEKVAPKEVEAVLYALSGVAEAAVIGVPDPVLGQAVKAIVVPRAGVTLTELQVLAHCRSNLENFMVPKFVEFRQDVPKNASGKIAKKELV